METKFPFAKCIKCPPRSWVRGKNARSRFFVLCILGTLVSALSAMTKCRVGHEAAAELSEPAKKKAREFRATLSPSASATMNDYPETVLAEVEAIAGERAGRFNPLRSLSPARLSVWLDEFSCGQFCNLAKAMHMIEERDLMIQPVAAKAKKAVARHGYEIIQTPTEDAGEKAQAKDQAAALSHFYDNLTATDAAEPDREEGFKLLVRQMMDAKGKRYSVHHIAWETGAGDITATFHHIPLWHLEATGGRLRFVGRDGVSEGDELEPRNAWLKTVGDGVMIPCTIGWMYKNLSLKDWVIYNGKYGFPIVAGSTMEEPGSPGWNTLKRAIRCLDGGTSVVKRVTEQIEKFELAMSGELPWPKLVEYMDRSIVTAWRGADLGTISQGGDGVGASLQGDETASIELDDAAWIEETLNRQVTGKVLDWHFGAGAQRFVEMHVKTAERKDFKSRLDTYCKAIANSYPVTLGQFGREFSIPLPPGADPEQLMEAPIVRQMQAAAEGDDGEEGSRQVFGRAARGRPVAKPSSPGIGTEPAINDGGGPVSAELVEKALAAEFDTLPAHLAPLSSYIETLVAEAEGGTLDDEAFLSFLETAADRLPELFGQLSTEERGEMLARAMGAGALRGILQSAEGREIAENANSVG